MRKRLFLTGPIGCGKSTAIAAALGDRKLECGGFFTRRYREPHLHFTLESPDGRKKETFLDFSAGKPEIRLEVFRRMGVAALSADVLILDEIGGIELLCPEFSAALEAVLQADIPILGVCKGEGPAGVLIQTLGLTEEYDLAAARLRNILKNDEHTYLYECGQFDEKARRLAEQWAEEYLHD